MVMVPKIISVLPIRSNRRTAAPLILLKLHPAWLPVDQHQHWMFGVILAGREWLHIPHHLITLQDVPITLIQRLKDIG